MATSSQIKRSPSHLEAEDIKRSKHHYHHHHRLVEPVVLPQVSEPALQDDDNVEHMMNRALGHALRDAGFEMADPAALSSFRSATEECTCCARQIRPVLSRTQKRLKSQTD